MLLVQSLRLDKHYEEVETDYNTPSTEPDILPRFPRMQHLSIGGSIIFRGALLIWSLLGASCVMADGLLTPAVSIISAVTGNLPIRTMLT